MDLPCRILLAVLVLAAILLMLPFLYPVQRGALPVLSWAPGYWQVVPGIGLARIVPLASARLVSPAAGAGQRVLRGRAVNAPARKY